MRKLILTALAIGALAMLAGCSSSSSGTLTGKNWQLTAITEKTPAFQGVIPAADQAKYAITFNTDGTYTGTADCNQIAGTYTTSGSSGITINPGISTMAMCPDGSFDALFGHGLSRAKSYSIANDTLTLTLDDQGTMTFVVGAAASTPAATSAATAAASATAKPTAKPTAAPTKSPAPGTTPAPATGLVGKAWQLTAVTEKVPAFQGVVPADQQANYTVEFKADGTFSAKADCNNVAGTFTSADPTAASGDLTLVLGPSTMVACAEGSFGDLYVLGLSNAESYAVASGQLTINLADGGTLTFK